MRTRFIILSWLKGKSVPTQEVYIARKTIWEHSTQRDRRYPTNHQQSLTINSIHFVEGSNQKVGRGASVEVPFTE